MLVVPLGPAGALCRQKGRCPPGTHWAVFAGQTGPGTAGVGPTRPWAASGTLKIFVILGSRNSGFHPRALIYSIAVGCGESLVYMSCSACGTLRVNVAIGASASAPAGVAVHRSTSEVPGGGGFGVGKIAPGGEYGCGKIARPLILTRDAQYGNRR